MFTKYVILLLLIVDSSSGACHVVHSLIIVFKNSLFVFFGFSFFSYNFNPKCRSLYALDVRYLVDGGGWLAGNKCTLQFHLIVCAVCFAIIFEWKCTATNVNAAHDKQKQWRKNVSLYSWMTQFTYLYCRFNFRDLKNDKETKRKKQREKFIKLQVKIQ